jgi:hypothetical protein
MFVFKKIISWIKNYWYVPVVIVGIIVLFVVTAGNPPAALIAAFQKARETHKKELEIIERSRRTEIEKRDTALSTYHNYLAAIEKKYQQENQELDDKKRKELKKLVEQNSEDPEQLTQLVAEKMGFKIVVSGD